MREKGAAENIMNEAENKLMSDAEEPVKIRLLYFGSVRAAAKKAEDTTELRAGENLLALLQRLSDIHGRDFRGEVLSESGAFCREDLMISLNETAINHAKAGEIFLRTGDTVAVYPVFSGGG